MSSEALTAKIPGRVQALYAHISASARAAELQAGAYLERAGRKTVGLVAVFALAGTGAWHNVALNLPPGGEPGFSIPVVHGDEPGSQETAVPDDPLPPDPTTPPPAPGDPVQPGADKAPVYPCESWNISKKEMKKQVTKVAEAKLIDNGVTEAASIAVGCADKLITTVDVGNIEGSKGKPDADALRWDQASGTKHYTMLTILMMEHEGLLSLDDKVSKWLPGWDEGWRSEATILHLLQHRAGFHEVYTGDPKYKTYDILMRDGDSPEAIEKNMIKYPLKNRPGEVYDYSNIGYHMLFMIGSKAAGMSFDEWQTQKLFEPLGINAGYTETTDDCATPGECQPEDRIARRLGASGHCGLWASATADIKLEGFLSRGGRINGELKISPKYFKMIFKPQADKKGTKNDKAYSIGATTNINNFASYEMSPKTVIHTGDIGTSKNFDPVSGLSVSKLIWRPWRSGVSKQPVFDANKAINDKVHTTAKP